MRRGEEYWLSWFHWSRTRMSLRVLKSMQLSDDMGIRHGQLAQSKCRFCSWHHDTDVKVISQMPTSDGRDVPAQPSKVQPSWSKPCLE